MNTATANASLRDTLDRSVYAAAQVNGPAARAKLIAGGCPKALDDLSSMTGIHGEIQCDVVTGTILVAHKLAYSIRRSDGSTTFFITPLGHEVRRLERASW